MPLLWLLAGYIICGIKFPFDLIRGANRARYVMFWKTRFGLRSGDPRIDAALARIREPGRTSHDLTNLPIEVRRYWTLTYEPNRKEGEPNATAGLAKLEAALVVWPWIIFAVLKLVL